MILYLHLGLLFISTDYVYMQTCGPGYSKIQTTATKNDFLLEIIKGSKSGINLNDVLFGSKKSVSLPVGTELSIIPKSGGIIQFLELLIDVKDIKHYTFFLNRTVIDITVTSMPQNPEKWETGRVRIGSGIMITDVHCVVIKFLEPRGNEIKNIMVRNLLLVGCTEAMTTLTTLPITDDMITDDPNGFSCPPNSRVLDITTDVKFKKQPKSFGTKQKSSSTFIGLPVTILPKGRFQLVVNQGRVVSISELSMELAGAEIVTVQWKPVDSRKKTVKVTIISDVVNIPLPLAEIPTLQWMKITLTAKPDTKAINIKWIKLNGCTKLLK